jgi:predicted  nucleic acid-binding Zn-ribbon protein
MVSGPDQLKLLELQKLDTQLGQLRHSLQTDSSISAVTELESRLKDVRRNLREAQIYVTDQQRAVDKVQGFIDEANSLIERGQAKVDEGSLKHKDALAVSEEMTALVARITGLEDQMLEAMERLEANTSAERLVLDKEQELNEALAAAVSVRDLTLAAIKDQGRGLVRERDTLAAQIDAGLVTRYNKIRERLGGVGAARYWGGRCEGCGLQLPPSDQERIAKARPDEVILCEECGRILVRVPGS